jgi:hypothetical protein
MIYLSGHGGAAQWGIGRMLAPTRGNLPLERDLPWAADTGCFATPERYADDWYLAWLRRLVPYRERCLFATAPDAFGDAEATLRVALPVLGRIRELGYRVALVAQPPLRVRDVPWSEIDCLFLGGPNAWQQSDAAHVVVKEAQRRGLWTHRGRVNSRARLLATKAMGFDSADGTCVAFGPDRRGGQMARWIAGARMQQVLLQPVPAGEASGACPG